MKKLLFILLVVTLSGCVTEKKCNKKYPPEVMVIYRDSIIRERTTVYRDTTIYVYIKGEKEYSTDTVYMDGGIIWSTKNHLFTSFADSWAWVENGRLYHELIQKDTLIGQEVKDAVRLTWERAERYYNKSEVQVKTERYIPKWAWWCFWISVASAAFCVYKVYRLIKKM